MKTLALVLEDEARRGGGAGGYCSGDTVSGQVLLELAGPLPLRGLRLEAAGRARVAWSESPGAVPGAGTWGVAVRAPGPGPRREAEVRYLDIRQSLLRDPPEGEAAPEGGGRGPGRSRSRGGGGTGGVALRERGNGHRGEMGTGARRNGCPGSAVPCVGAEKRGTGAAVKCAARVPALCGFSCRDSALLRIPSALVVL